MGDAGFGKRVPRRESIVLAGAMAGLACGVKLTAVPEVLVAGALALLLVARRENDSSRLGWKNRFSGAGLYLLTGIAVFSPWLIRNEVWARNPVFPEAARLIGSGDFSPPQVARWEHAYVPHVNAKERVETLWGQIEGDWRFGFVLLPLGIVGA